MPGPKDLLSVVKVVAGISCSLDEHARGCCEWVSAIALHPSDYKRLGIVEVWGLPVLAWDHVTLGCLQILCDAQGVLVPQYDTAEEVLAHAEHQLRRPAPSV
jgi:hypothetical protein